jgi:hypothetical protein
MIENPVWRLMFSVSRMAMASALFAARTATNLMLRGMEEPIGGTASALDEASRVLGQRRKCGCRQKSQQQSQPQPVGSGWGPVNYNE